VTPTGRNLVLCCDGTNNEFGRENTNVVRLAQVLDRDPSRQRLYYDPGVGTLPEPSTWSATGKWLSKVLGLAFGGGIFWKVDQAYRFLMDEWRPGDRVFIFGFSRGAYTARLLAALLHHLGLLPRGNGNLVPYAIRLFRAAPAGDDGGGGIEAYEKLANEFRWSFARVVPESPDERRFRVHFLGLWDTVSSVGWAWERRSFPFTARNPSVNVVRHAVSIDERRWFFRQNQIHQARPDQDVDEVWYPGVHSDVGGGYPVKDGLLWAGPLMWMLDAAKAQGLLLDQARIPVVYGDAVRAAAGPVCLEPKHESLTPVWWPLEFYPKWTWRRSTRKRALSIGAGRHRFIRPGSLIHHDALVRLRSGPDYRPPNLSEAFVQRVLALQNVPPRLPYEP
jgi:uncharacterized protein (DUF2235 family)